MKKVYILALFGSLLFADCVRDNQNEIVTCDNLMWQDDKEVAVEKKDFEASKIYCQNLKLGNYSNWRVPSIKELRTTTDKNYHDPTLKKVFKNYSLSTFYASNTKTLTFDEGIWVIYFNTGEDMWGGITDSALIRCVRNK